MEDWDTPGKDTMGDIIGTDFNLTHQLNVQCREILATDYIRKLDKSIIYIL